MERRCDVTTERSPVHAHGTGRRGFLQFSHTTQQRSSQRLPRFRASRRLGLHWIVGPVVLDTGHASPFRTSKYDVRQNPRDRASPAQAGARAKADAPSAAPRPARHAAYPPAQTSPATAPRGPAPPDRCSRPGFDFRSARRCASAQAHRVLHACPTGAWRAERPRGLRGRDRPTTARCPPAARARRLTFPAARHPRRRATTGRWSAETRGVA